MSDIILISDGEDDIISLPGPSRPRPRPSQPMRVPLTGPIFIEDSDDDEPPLPPAAPVQEMSEYIAGLLAGHKGKRKASPSIVDTSRSALLGLLANDSWRLDTPPESDNDSDTPLAESAKKSAAKKKKVDSGAQADKAEKAAEAARKKEEKEQARLMEKEEKARQKDAAKLAKEVAKSLAAKERDVNKVSYCRVYKNSADWKLRRSKDDTVREIHVYMTADLMATKSPIAAALPEIRARLESNESKLRAFQADECFLPSTIRFKRHVKARYDGALKKWVCLDRDRWEWEPTVLIVAQAEDIVDSIMTHDEGLAEWASDARLTLGLQPSDQIMVIIKGLTKYYAKTKTLENREFTAAARAGLGERDVTRRNTAVRPDKDKIESELVKLQVAEQCFLVHVESTEDIENWIFNLAADVAIRPYKLLEKSHLNFCPPEGGKKGTNPQETFELMLREVQGITQSAAAGIAAEYPSFKSLMDAYERAERRGNPEQMLEDCEVRNLRNGTANGRRLNKALSKRVYLAFRSRDGLALNI